VKSVAVLAVLLELIFAAQLVAASDQQRIRSLIEEKKASRALDLALSIQSKYLEDSEFFFLKGRAYQDLKLNIEALEAYSESISLKRANYKAFINRGLVKGALGNLKASLIDLKRAVEINPSSKLAQLNLGVTHAAQNEPQKAIKAFTNALIIDPNFSEALRNRGITYHHIGEKIKACDDWSSYIKLQTDEVATWHKGLCK